MRYLSNVPRLGVVMCMVLLISVCLPQCTAAAAGDPCLPWFDTTLPFETRVELLVSEMTLDEKVGQMQDQAPAIERLGIPAYNWWNEALHGVARNGVATVFPQAIGLAATWDIGLHYQIATAISDEARAKHHEALRHNDFARYAGLTLWSPNINIFRDPRWGRGQETYGEDPYLTSQFGVAFVKGLQGADPRYLKTVATPKHFAVHSGPEPIRHSFDAKVDLHDLWDTYLPAFEACVCQAKAVSVMSAYNRVNGQPCSMSTMLLGDILYKKWGFAGYVVSDCGAIHNIFAAHKIVSTAEEAAALSVKAGCNLNCGNTYAALKKAVQLDLITESEIDSRLRPLLLARFRLGMFDPPAMVPYAKIPYSVNDSAEHNKLALQAGRESIVLLKNEHNTLPLPKDLKTIAVIGPNADSNDVLVGNYNGTPSHPVTILAGIRNAVSKNTTVLFDKGCPLAVEKNGGHFEPNFTSALSVAAKSDVIILVLGISPALEGEEMRVNGFGPLINKYEGFRGGDRLSIDLPSVQQQLMEAVYKTGKPIVLVLTSGSALAVNWADKHVPAILQAWYPGQQGGNAVGDVIFGNYNPAGRLPVTFYKSVDDLPALEDYDMANRTYRYFKGRPLYAFGYGLSYTKFSYSSLALARDGNDLKVTVKVKNAGKRDGDEVVELYVSPIKPAPRDPIRALRAFCRIPLEKGQAKTVEFRLAPRQLMFVDEQGVLIKPPQGVTISVGSNIDSTIAKDWKHL